MRIIKLESELAVSDLARSLTDAGLHVEEKEPLTENTSVHLRLADGDEGDISLAAQTLAKFLLNDWLYAHIDERICSRHSYLTDDERQYVALLTLHALRKADIDKQPMLHWEQVLATSTAHALQGPVTHLHLAGVMRFRARSVLQATDTGVEEFIAQFLADREYEEFVSLLRYMLESQPATRKIMHVFCTDDRMWLCDETGQLITDNEVTDAAHLVSNEGEVNAEDLAMSVLITNSPCKIVIHDTTHDAPWPSFAETVERVFLERAERCHDCEACDLLEHGETQHTANEKHRFAMPDDYE